MKKGCTKNTDQSAPIIFQRIQLFRSRKMYFLLIFILDLFTNKHFLCHVYLTSVAKWRQDTLLLFTKLTSYSLCAIAGFHRIVPWRSCTRGDVIAVLFQRISCLCHTLAGQRCLKSNLLAKKKVY